ncbi:non-specific lipid transfer protein GPI-anchored 1-like [Canna indica]|uniref:Non-specific lipid transfer protein GPI-anchored 1-like n=1 Tax=Canna indica TaxID=4628 RepID=A0AAQ3KDJ4_9LILI|nr:non-specific lipid transfer protein GPI-anchored 1-like [Canna indica]
MISSWCSSSLLLFVCVVGLVAGDDSVQQKCAQTTTKMLPCLDYASGKKDEPPSSCCTVVTDIRKTDPACLCFVIQQAHSGSPGFRSLDLKVDRLVQLPSICKLANSSVSDCPKLLGIPPSSPEYSIFTNISTANIASSGSTPSEAFVHQIYLYGTLAIVLVTATYLSMLS